MSTILSPFLFLFRSFSYSKSRYKWQGESETTTTTTINEHYKSLNSFEICTHRLSAVFVAYIKMPQKTYIDDYNLLSQA